MKFNTGEKVRVVDYTHTYAGYSEWVMGYCFGLFDKWKENLERTSKETRKWADVLPIKDLGWHVYCGGGSFLSVGRNANEFFRVPNNGTVGKIRKHAPHGQRDDYLYLVEIEEHVFLIGEKGLELFIEKNETLEVLKEINKKLEHVGSSWSSIGGLLKTAREIEKKNKPSIVKSGKEMKKDSKVLLLDFLKLFDKNDRICVFNEKLDCATFGSFGSLLEDHEEFNETDYVVKEACVHDNSVHVAISEKTD